MKGVSGATAERIRQTAISLGYRPPPLTKKAAPRKAGTVVVIMPYITRWFFAEVLGGAEKAIRAGGLDLLLYNVGDIGARERYFSSSIARRSVEGVLVVCLELTSAERDALSSLDVPVCTVGTVVRGFSSVTVDDTLSASIAVQHLVNLGHRRIGFLAGETNEPELFTHPLRRREGYRAALDAAGLTGEGPFEACGPYTVEGGEAAAMDLLGHPVLPTAIFAECDEMAFGALRALKRVGLRVPEDISVVGFDDHPMASNLDLTTVSQNVPAQGHCIAKHLTEAIVARREIELVQMSVPTRLVVRGTTAVHSGKGVPLTLSKAAPPDLSGRVEIPPLARATLSSP